jgi:hypothetical protein
MSYILHLGHQVTDLAGVENRIATDAAGFDPELDVNCVRISAGNGSSVPFSASWPLPAGDVWLGFRYRAPSITADNIEYDGMFLEFYDAANRQVAQVRTESSDQKYHAMALGDSTVEGASSFIAATSQTYWIDVRVAVGAEITVEFHVDGVLQSSAQAANVNGKGRPVRCVWRNLGLYNSNSTATWYYAHIAVLDGVSTIGRRFVRRIPDLVATYDQMSGSVAALADDDIATRVASDVAGQRLSFSLAGPVGPATPSAIAAVHLKQIAQAGTSGPTGAAGFLRIGGVDHDAMPGAPSPDVPTPLYSSWASNPGDGSGWTSATLPAELGIVSA